MANEVANRETSLGRDVFRMREKASSIVITDDAGCELAGDALKQIKALNTAVTQYWEPLRASAYSAWQSVMAKKKEMIRPLEEAEKALKGKVGQYLQEKERKRLEEEAKLKATLQAEKEKRLAEADACEEAGDLLGAEFARMDADVLEGAAATAVVAPQKPKQKGISSSKNWQVVSVDPAKVPVNFNGVELRPVDMAAVRRLIKASKGTIQIPGIVYEETVSISVSARP